MDGALAIVLISLAMFVGCFLLGMIPVLFRLSEQKLRFVSVFGAGLLCGTALAVIIPEGVELMEESWKASMCFNLSGSEVSSSSSSSPDVSSRTGLPPNFLIGVSLVIGFTLMFVVDQIGTYCSIHDPQTGMSNSTSVTATLGLVIHAATDGIALGAAVASSQVSVQVIVFFAVILHKAPAAFGLVSFLMHAGVQRRAVQKHLLAFSAAAPVLAITTYFILHATGGASWPSAVGIGMLFSAGTFLYVAMVHVLPEINSRGHHHPNGMQQHSGTPAYQQGGLGILESLLLISGTALPTLLTLGLHDD